MGLSDDMLDDLATPMRWLMILCNCGDWWVLLRVKPKLPGAKTRSCRFPEVTGGMDNGFSSCAAPAFCRGPGISDRGRYMRVLQAVRQL